LSSTQIYEIPVHFPNTREKLSFFFQGILISVPLTIFFETVARDYLYAILPPHPASFVLVTLAAPVIEEYFKIFPLFHRHAETPRGLFDLGFLMGLGFGISEFFVYVFLMKVSFIIRIPAVLFHATNTSLVAYGVGKNKITRYYLLAVALHFSNNFFAEFGNLWLIGGLGAVLISYYLSYKYYNITTSKILV
jgi:RsiW-degrading membrane proteinase PrsW (M82 family)